MAADRTNTQRQAKHRNQLGQRGDSRLNLNISSAAKLELEHMARHYGVSMRYVVEQLAQHATERLVAKLTPEQRDGYYTGSPAEQIRGA